MIRNEATITDREYEILSDFRFIIRRFLSFSNKKARSVGLTPRQHQCLLTIKGSGKQGGLVVGQLAEQLQIHHNSAVGLINRLTEQQLVRRFHASDDKRKVHVILTKKGENILKLLTATHKEELKRIGPEMSKLLNQLTDDFNS
ncbi:MAG TPA: MarR family transcriptional regulator [Balneolales bacterium]|nr:MarR family transcriptional regulator [Balneolales bacterium]